MLYIQKSESIPLLKEFYSIISKIAPLYLCNQDSGHQITVDVAFSSLATKITSMLQITTSDDVQILLIKCLLRMGINTGCIEFILAVISRIRDIKCPIDLSDEMECFKYASSDNTLISKTLKIPINEWIIKEEIHSNAIKIKESILMAVHQGALYVASRLLGLNKLVVGKRAECISSNKNALEFLGNNCVPHCLFSFKEQLYILFTNTDNEWFIKVISDDDQPSKLIYKELPIEEYSQAKAYGCYMGHTLYLLSALRNEKYANDAEAKEYMYKLKAIKLKQDSQTEVLYERSFQIMGPLPKCSFMTSECILFTYKKKLLRIFDIKTGGEMFKSTYKGEGIRSICADVANNRLFTCGSDLRLIAYSIATIPGGINNKLGKLLVEDKIEKSKNDPSNYNINLLQWIPIPQAEQSTNIKSPIDYIKNMLKVIHKNSIIGIQYFHIMDRNNNQEIFKLYKYQLGIHLTTNAIESIISLMSAYQPTQSSTYDDYLIFLMLMQILMAHIVNLNRCGITSLYRVIKEPTINQLKEISMRVLNDEYPKPPLSMSKLFDPVIENYYKKFIISTIHLVSPNLDFLIAKLSNEIGTTSVRNETRLMALIKSLRKSKVLKELLLYKNQGTLKKLLDAVFSVALSSYKSNLYSKSPPLFQLELIKMANKLVPLALIEMGYLYYSAKDWIIRITKYKLPSTALSSHQ
jgi:hypothetical protein